MYIEKAPSNRSTCKTCRRRIPKGVLRVTSSGMGTGDKMCIPCLKAELLLAGISLTLINDKDFALLTAKLLKGELKREQLMFDYDSEMEAGRDIGEETDA